MQDGYMQHQIYTVFTNEQVLKDWNTIDKNNEFWFYYLAWSMCLVSMSVKKKEKSSNYLEGNRKFEKNEVNTIHTDEVSIDLRI